LAEKVEQEADESASLPTYCSLFWQQEKAWAWRLPVNAFTVSAGIAPDWLAGICGIILILDLIRVFFWKANAERKEED
jgi:hypothetical protein